MGVKMVMVKELHAKGVQYMVQKAKCKKARKRGREKDTWQCSVKNGVTNP